MFLRRALGVIMAVATLRYFWHGWIDAQFVEPKFHFTYAGFGWVHPLPEPFMELVFGIIGAAALLLALDRAPRFASFVLLLAFSYVQLCDKANYLNHYYLVSLLCAYFALLPSGAGGRIALGWIVALRLQVMFVYVHAGIAKWDASWLLEGEPLRLWLAALDAPGPLGAVLSSGFVAISASWGGMLLDVSAPFLLASRRTRRYAFTLVATFHVATAALFPIGIFPWLMIAAATVFFEPSWWGPPVRAARAAAQQGAPVRVAAVAGLLLFQAMWPLRSLAAPGDPHWTEDGFRFSWKVMLIEKAATVEYVVVQRDAGRVERRVVDPRAELTRFQVEMMSGQPDMLLEYAHHLAERARFDAPVGATVEVYARSLASLNGGVAAPLIRPGVNLASIERSAPRAAYVTLSAREGARLL